jgi:hypothetical protein
MTILMLAEMNTPPRLLPPRWPGGPPICDKANLPAFDSRAAAEAFHEGHTCTRIAAIWRCRFGCGLWHFYSMKAITVGKDPEPLPDAIRRLTE